jgi:hypothetical protein
LTRKQEVEIDIGSWSGNSSLTAIHGFDHGAGHSLLLLYDAKTSHGENINDFNTLGYDPSAASASVF